MSITVTLQSILTVAETLSVAAPDVSTPRVTHNSFNTQATLTSTTTPPVTKVASFQKALAAGVGTINLTSLPGTITGTTVDGTGLKVQAYKFANPSTNANDITVTFGASNPYLLHGTGWKITLRPGEEVLWKGIDASGMPDIDATHKNIDLSGTGVQALNVEIVMG